MGLDIKMENWWNEKEENFYLEVEDYNFHEPSPFKAFLSIVIVTLSFPIYLIMYEQV